MSDVSWEYRVVRRITENDSDWYSVEEIYFDDDGSPMALTIDLQVEGENIEEMKAQLDAMKKAFDKPTLNESDIVPASIEKYKNKEA